MFLNQVHFAWRDFGRPNGRRAALLLLAPLALIALLLLPAVLAMPPVADHAALSGTDSSTGPELHLRGSYRLTLSITGQAGCTYGISVGPFGVGELSFPAEDATSAQQRSTWDVPDLSDGMYTIAMTATGCGPWTVTVDRPLDAG
jgi:hypothetical protein